LAPSYRHFPTATSTKSARLIRKHDPFSDGNNSFRNDSFETQENIGTDPADLESFKAATIAASNLETSQKMGAVADFDACVTSNQSAPHKRFSYRRNDYPGGEKNMK